MDLDKIVTDLVEVRLEQELRKRLTEAIEGYSHEAAIKEVVAKAINEALAERSDEIKAKIHKAIDEVVLQGDITNSFSVGVKFNTSWYELERLVKLKKPAEGQT